MQVFVSYQRRDALLAAHLVGYALRAAGHGAFVDTGSIDGGVPFRDSIAGAVAGSNVLVALVGAGFEAARLHEPGSVIAFEWQRARFHGVPVVPVLVDRPAMLDDAALPAPLRWFGRRNAWPLRSPTLGPDVDRLVAGLPLLAVAPRQALRVLWVDDKPSNNEGMRAWLRPLGLVFDNVVSSKEALLQLAQESYDLVITDLGRHDSSDRSWDAGADLLDRLAQWPEAPPVVVFAGRQALDREAELRGRGAAAVCVDPSVLERHVRALLGREDVADTSAIVPR